MTAYRTGQRTPDGDNCREQGGEIEKSWYTAMHTVERNGKRFLYESRWEGGRCVKRYVGTGPQAEQLAQRDSEARLQRQLEQQRWLSLLPRIDAAQEPLDALCRHAKLLHHAMLLLAGYHLHKGYEWRRRSSSDG